MAASKGIEMNPRRTRKRLSIYTWEFEARSFDLLTADEKEALVQICDQVELARDMYQDMYDIVVRSCRSFVEEQASLSRFIRAHGLPTSIVHCLKDITRSIQRYESMDDTSHNILRTLDIESGERYNAHSIILDGIHGIPQDVLLEILWERTYNIISLCEAMTKQRRLGRPRANANHYAEASRLLVDAWLIRFKKLPKSREEKGLLTFLQNAVPMLSGNVCNCPDKTPGTFFAELRAGSAKAEGTLTAKLSIADSVGAIRQATVKSIRRARVSTK